jgi:hypothetical protein
MWARRTAGPRLGFRCTEAPAGVHWAAVRRVLLILSPVAAVAAILVAVPMAAATSAQTAAVHVRPSTGGPRTAFSVTVRIPSQTGTFVGFRRWDSLSAGGPSGKGCVASTEMPLPAAAAGSTVRVRVAPGRGSHWCAGTFHGVITQSESARCGGPPQEIACPMLMIRPQTIGRFRFVVRRG